MFFCFLVLNMFVDKTCWDLFLQDHMLFMVLTCDYPYCISLSLVTVESKGGLFKLYEPGTDVGLQLPS